MKPINRTGFYLNLLSNSISLTKKRDFLATLILVFFTGTLSVSAKAQSAVQKSPGQNTGKCQSSFTRLSKELENLLTQNRDKKKHSDDVIKDMDNLIENEKANPNEAFMWASLREETDLTTYLAENYKLDPSAVIEYAFKKGISKKEVDNLILYGIYSRPYLFLREERFLNEVFIHASTEQNLEISTYLIEKYGMNVNDAFLHIAQRGDIKTATYLIENHGADINYSAGRGLLYTLFDQAQLEKLLDLHPLIVASAYGQGDFVKYLLQKGKDSFDEIIIDKAFSKAVELGHKETVKVFIESKALQDLEHELIVALITTISTPKTRASQDFAHFLIGETIKWMDKKPVQQTNSLLMYSLALATSKNLKSKVELLIQKGAGVYEAHFAVNSAIRNEHIDLALYLLNHIKNGNLRDNSDLITDSHLIAVSNLYFYRKHNKNRQKIKQIINLLIEIEKYDPKERINGISYLMRIATVGTAQQVERLIGEGHDIHANNIHANNKSGQNVADYALRNEDPGPLKVLYKKGARITEDYSAYDFFEGAKLKIEHVKILIQNGFDINTRIGKTSLLHVATLDLDVKGVEFLLKNGAKVGITKHHGTERTEDMTVAEELLNENLEFYNRRLKENNGAEHEKALLENHEKALAIQKLFQQYK